MCGLDNCNSREGTANETQSCRHCCDRAVAFASCLRRRGRRVQQRRDQDRCQLRTVRAGGHLWRCLGEGHRDGDRGDQCRRRNRRQADRSHQIRQQIRTGRGNHSDNQACFPGQGIDRHRSGYLGCFQGDHPGCQSEQGADHLGLGNRRRCDAQQWATTGVRVPYLLLGFLSGHRHGELRQPATACQDRRDHQGHILRLR